MHGIIGMTKRIDEKNLKISFLKSDLLKLTFRRRDS